MSTLVTLAVWLASLTGATNVEQARYAGLSWVGFNENIYQRPVVASGEETADRLAAIAPGGVMRVPLDWRNVQAGPGSPIDFSRFDREVIDPALSRGLRPLIIVMSAPQWAWGSSTCKHVRLAARGRCIMPPGNDPLNLWRWFEFVRAVAQHYGDDAIAIEVWNEQNAPSFWSTTKGPDPEHYADLLCLAHRAVRSVSLDLPVILGGLAAGPPSERRIAAANYLAALYEGPGHDVRRCMTAIGVHPYPGQAAPTTPISRFSLTLEGVRAVRSYHDHPSRPLWITEFGYWTRGGPSAVGEREQATMLDCALRVVAAMGDVKTFIIHSLIDHGGTTREGSFGVYRSSPSGAIEPKPAAFVLRQIFTAGEQGLRSVAQTDRGTGCALAPRRGTTSIRSRKSGDQRHFASPARSPATRR